MAFLLSNISRGLQDNIPYCGRCLSAIIDPVLCVSKLLQDMHKIMVSGLPAGCRLTAIFDVSNPDASRLNANFSIGMPLWLGTRYESIHILHEAVLKISVPRPPIHGTCLLVS